jgi:hypothetical protein
MSYVSQCVNVPFGASGSSMMTAKLRAPAGASAIVSGGAWSLPSHVNCLGITAPSANAELVNLKAMPVSPSSHILTIAAAE